MYVSASALLLHFIRKIRTLIIRIFDREKTLQAFAGVRRGKIWNFPHLAARFRDNHCVRHTPVWVNLQPLIVERALTKGRMKRADILGEVGVAGN